MAPIVEGSSSKARTVINSPTSTASSWAIAEPTPPSQSPTNQTMEQVTFKFEEAPVKDHVKIGKRGNEVIHQANDSASKSNEVDPTNPPKTIKFKGVKYTTIRDGEMTDGNGDGDENETPIIPRGQCDYSSEPIKFLVGESETAVYVHRNLLSCAPGLEELCEQAQGQPIRLSENRLDIFTALVHWLYDDLPHIRPSGEETALLYSMAIKYKIEDMKPDLLWQLCCCRGRGYGCEMVCAIQAIYEAITDAQDPIRSFLKTVLKKNYNFVPLSEVPEGEHPLRTLLLNYAEHGGWLAADILEVFLDVGVGMHGARLEQEQDKIDVRYGEAYDVDSASFHGFTGPGPAYVEDGDEDGEIQNPNNCPVLSGWDVPLNTEDSWPSHKDQKNDINDRSVGWDDAEEDNANYVDDEVAYGNGKRKEKGISADKHTNEKLTEWEDQAESSRRAYISTGKGNHLNRARNADIPTCDSVQHHPCVSRWNVHNQGQPQCVSAASSLPPWVQQGPFSQGCPAALLFYRPEATTGFTQNYAFPQAAHPIWQQPASPKEDCMAPKGGW